MKWLGKPSPFHLFTNPCVIKRFIFGQGVVIYYVSANLPSCCPDTCQPISIQLNVYNSIYELRNMDLGYAKPKLQISCVVTAQMNSAVVFDTHKVQSFFFLNPKFQACSHLLRLHSIICGQKH